MAQMIYYSKWTLVKSDTHTTVPVLDTCTGIGFCTAKLAYLSRPGIQLAWALVQMFYCMLFTRFKLT